MFLITSNPPFAASAITAPFIKIKNASGKVTNILLIKDNCANMIEANCPDKLCVNQKAISKEKETIVCLPNKVVVTVESDDESDFDAIAN